MSDDVTWWGAAGVALVVLAIVAVFADRRRGCRSDLDKVGWVPWTPLFFVALLGACVALGLAVRAWLAG